MMRCLWPEQLCSTQLQLVQILCESQGLHVHVPLQDKEKWSKEKFEIANKAKTEAARLSALEQEAQDKAK